MSKNLANDTFIFENKNLHDAFNLALEKGNMFLKENPESNYTIHVDGQSKKLTLNYEHVSVRRHFGTLYGPGSVPGLLSEEDMVIIESLSTRLPKSGNFVEIGTFLGKSAVEWAKNLQKQNKDFNIICIDSFNSPIEIVKELLVEAEFDIPEGNTQLELFKYYTSEFKNIQALEVFFNKDYVMDIPLAGVFEDSDHSQAALHYALPYWWKKIIPGGLLTGHDYSDEVKLSVDQFALLNNLKVETFAPSSIWCIEKPVC